MPRNITPKQQAFLDFLVAFTNENGYWPSYREIGDHFGYISPNSTTQNIRALLRKGYLTRTEGGYAFTDRLPPLLPPARVALENYLNYVLADLQAALRSAGTLPDEAEFTVETHRREIVRILRASSPQPLDKKSFPPKLRLAS